MFQLGLFKIRAFAAGSAAGLIAATARGGLQFMLIIWLQGVWLPLHGYSFTETPLWAGIYLLPLTTAFLISGPVCGYLSDRFGARGFATAGMLVFAASFVGLMLLPVDFPYWAFAALLVLNGIGVGMFSAPNSASIMSSVPARYRGAASGMRSTFQNTGTALSIGVFFSLLIAGLGDQPSGAVAPWTPGAGCLARDRPPGREPAAGLVAVRGGARREPGGAPARADRRVVFGVRGAAPGTDGHVFLPAADRGRVPRRPRGRVQRRHRAVGARRRRLADARRPLRPHRRAPTHERIAR